MKRQLLIVMSIMLCVGFFNTVSAQQKMSLKQALQEIQKAYGTKFSYQAELIDGLQATLTLPLSKSQPVERALKQVLYPNKLLFLYVQDNYYTLITDNREQEVNTDAARSNIPEPNYRTITGKVTDAIGMPLVSATVFPEGMGNRNGSVTSSDGSFTLRLQQEATALVVTYVGMQPKKIPLGKTNVINVTMDDNLNLLKEVSVVSMGYTKLPKERATGAFGSITSKEIREVPSINILERIENLTPGVQVDLKQNTIRVRGVNSFSTATASPLIVVDGFPVMETTDRAGNLSDVVSNVSGGAILNRYNPEDIESITILKDAAATSIWGARAGNGVIVIETKRGKNGPTAVNFSTNLSISSPADLNKLNTMTSAQYIDLEREVKELGFLTDPAIKQDWQTFNSNAPLGEALEWMFKVDRGTATVAEGDEALARLSQIDNKSQIRDLMMQKAVTQQYNLSLSGGANKSSYYISGNYTRDLPVFRENLGQSFFLTSNLTNKLFNDRLTLNIGINYTYSNSVNNPTAANTISTGVLGLRPYELLRDENGNNIERSIRFRDEVSQDFLDKGYLPWTYSALDDLYAVDNQTSANRFRFNMDATTKLGEGLTFSVLGSLQRNLEVTEDISSVDSYYVRDMVNYGTTINTAGKRVYGVPMGGTLRLANYDGWEYNLRGQLNVDKQLASFVKLNLIGGAEIRQTRYQSSNQVRYGFNPDTYSNLIVNPTANYTNVEGWSSQIGYNDNLAKNINRALSYYSNAGLSFLNDKYVVSGSLRFDDYTLTGAARNQRAKPLWSAGVKWNAKMENFMQNVNWLDALSFRMTYGVAGTMPKSAANVVVINTSTDNNTNEQIASIASPANNQISWEKVKTFNLGTDFAVLHGRLSFNVDIYQKRMSDILYRLPFNPTYGWTSLEFNSASMKGNGFELGMRMDVIKNKAYGWSSLFNFSYNTNEVTDNRIVKNTTTNLVNGSFAVGLPLDYMYAYRWAGLDDKGQSQVYNKNGEIISSAVGNNMLSADDLVYQGRTTAPYFGAFNNDFRYKQFNLGVRISYSMGNVLRRSSVQNYPDYVGYRGVIGSQKDLAERWRQPGDEDFTNVPGLKNVSYNSLQRYTYSDLLTISGSYIRLQQISLSYNAPAALLKGSPFKSASFSASARNLGLIWTKNKDGIDPAYLYTNNYNNLPPAKAFFISINTSF
ncbi:SusC/RagA family TonB-linked outer membrane protein [Pedobacter sp. BAL39]|uniref:SusC/RagA family TonB-linked outer membrane protein n=1 Tax=Pedobacter sp. BAL39 TaxID=391596 RepID=UPI0009FC81F9|nr:SusC/RagA family TonB-linked outer membrane protein [Pedobacter sp. BAL39]